MYNTRRQWNTGNETGSENIYIYIYIYEWRTPEANSTTPHTSSQGPKDMNFWQKAYKSNSEWAVAWSSFQVVGRGTG